MVASNDFSLFALFTAGLAALVRADDGPTANAVRLPGLHDVRSSSSVRGCGVVPSQLNGTVLRKSL